MKFGTSTLVFCDRIRGHGLRVGVFERFPTPICRPTTEVGVTGSPELRYRSFPRPSAAPTPIGGRFITTKPARSRWRSTRSAAMAAIYSSALSAPRMPMLRS
jgi:hypothetical protein